MHGRLKDASAGFPRKNLGTSKSGRCFASEELVWDGLQLRLGSVRGRILVTVEPDSKWTGMCRVRHDGNVTDIVNLTRAKDAAISIALSQLNSAKEAA
jgi:hypothetical protein